MATLARWWCELNCWKWPNDLPREVKIYDFLDHFYHFNDPKRNLIPTKHDFNTIIMDAISKKISERSILMYWNCVYNHVGSMTIDEFNNWWSLHHEGIRNVKGIEQIDKMMKRRIPIIFPRFLLMEGKNHES